MEIKNMAEEKKLPRHKRLYKDSPKMERGEDGHMGVTKRGDKENEAETAADAVQSGDDGIYVTEGMPPHVRHAHERRDMHNRHETEHSVHDHAKAGSKKEMHGRHQKEMKDMHGRHEKEIESGEHKDMDIKEGHETGKDKGASETKSEKKE